MSAILARGNRAHHRPLAQRSAPERHVDEVEVTGIAHVDAVIRAGGAPVNRVARTGAARAAPSRPSKTDDSSSRRSSSRYWGMPSRFSPALHRRSSTQNWPAVTPPMECPKTPRRVMSIRAARRPIGPSDVRFVESIDHEPGVFNPAPQREIGLLKSAKISAQKPQLLRFVGIPRDRRHGFVFAAPLTEDVGNRLEETTRYCRAS